MMILRIVVENSACCFLQDWFPFFLLLCKNSGGYHWKNRAI